MASDDYFLNDEEQRLIWKALRFYSEHPEYHPGTDNDARAQCTAAELLARVFQPFDIPEATFIDEHPRWIGPGHDPSGNEYA